ncbi:hypothetical protein [Halovivax cerinus]|uniref:Uncharacterized protein n=1 Tax=Halovivax cerinus TaxID=1487865 RepID=A0ABD5NR58_9EURY|nr:hypothetical protein [Halovivax cerinus]
MVDIEVVDTTILGTDLAGNTAAIETSGWDRLADVGDLPDSAVGRDGSGSGGAAVAGRVNTLSFPWVHTWVWKLEDGRRTFETKLTDDRIDRRLEPGTYRFTFDSEIQVRIEFDGRARITRQPDQTVTVSFPQPTLVRIAFRSFVDAPKHTVTVPRTATGVARALESFAVARHWNGPDLASPLERGHPPRIRFGDETDIPAAVRESIGETGIELRVPDRLDALIPLASLAFYLGATVTVTDEDGVALRAQSVDFERALSPFPGLQHEVAAMLERIVSLDNLLRFSTQDTDLAELDEFATLDLDVGHLYEADLDERLQAYLDPDLAYDRLETVLPQWHYTMYVEPTFDRVPSLPALANRLARIYLPSAVDEAGRVGPTPGNSAYGANGDSGPFTGWLAQGTPIGPFLSRPAAYENRTGYLNDQTPDRVALVATDDRWADAVEIAREAYRGRPAYPANVDVYEAATVAELRSVLEDGGIFVHYVGEVDGEAFVCTDGTLATEEMACAGRTVLLDAPNSLPAAAALVDRGSVTVLAQRGEDRLGAEVRRTVLKLLGDGMAVDHAVRFARRYLGTSDDLVTVGDGLSQVGNAPNVYALVYRLEALGDGTFSLSGDVQYPDVGAMWTPGFPGAKANIAGNSGDLVVDASDLRTLVSNESPAVIVYEGECYFTDDLEPFYPAA